MKTPTAGLIAALLTTAAQGGIDIPKSVYKADQVEAACAEAVKEKKALAFVLTDPGTSCGLCIGATDMAFEKLKAHSVVVFLNSEVASRWEPISPMVVTGFSEDHMGNTIPKAVITSPDMSEIWLQMSYAKLRTESSYRDAKKQIDAILKGGPKPESPPDRAIYWPLKGKESFYIGSFAGLDDKGNLRLKMLKGGKVSSIPLDRLSPPCATFARTLAGTKPSAGPQSAANQTPALESWTGSNGKSLQARFVSLADDKVTLEMEDGKTHTLSLDRLAESSRNRAKELAGE